MASPSAAAAPGGAAGAAAGAAPTQQLHRNWETVYPCYINAKRTIPEGRRIPIAKACENPNVLEIRDVCNAHRLRVILENKRHPRDWQVPGRAKIQLFDDAGAPLNPAIPNRKTLWEVLAEDIPKLASRTQAASAAAAAASSAAAGGGSAAKKGKSGKKKGR